MKQHQRKIMVFLLLFMAGCSVPIATVATPETTAYTSPTRVSSLVTLVTPTPTLTSPKVTPSLTPTVISLATPTPQPTLSADKAKELVFGLLKNNGDCRLPCFWGLTPGQIDLQTFSAFTGKFGNTFTLDSYIARRDFGPTGGFTVIYRENGVNIRVAFAYYQNKESTQLEQLVMHADSLYEKGQDPNWKSSTEISPLYGDASFAQALQYYTLPQILSNYGRPSQVLVGTFRDAPDDYPNMFHPFSLVLFYQEQGFFAEYASQRETVGNDFVGCPAKAYIRISAWDPKSGLSLTDIVKRGGDVINDMNLDYFKPVDKATALTLDEFYEAFKDPKNTACLKTRIDVWPKP
jgi:hypothetical protein